VPSLSESAGFRRVRVVIAVYAWLACFGLFVQLLVGTGGAVSYLAAGLSLSVLVSWWLRPQADTWSAAVLEGLAVCSSFLVLHTAGPAIAFMFGVTVRRGIQGGPHPWPMKLSLALVGYVAGFVYWSVGGMGTRGGHLDGASFVAGILPLLGLVITSLALYETVRATRSAESARVIAHDARSALSAVVQASPVGLVVLDETGASRLHNRRARTLLNWDDDPAAPNYVPCPHGDNIARCAQGCCAAPGPIEVRLRRSGGDTRVLALEPAPVVQASGTNHTVLAIVDVSKRSEWEDTLRIRSERDDLTGLVSRVHLLELLDRALHDAAGPVSLLVIDLDQFKEINDTDGHEAGDLLLIQVAARIREAVGADGVAARLGGDEFAVLVTGHDASSCLRMGGRVLAALSQPQTGFERAPAVRASVGIAIAAGGTTADVLRDADAAMYVAKRQGGARVRLFRPRIGAVIVARQQSKVDLRRAVYDNQLVVHYQPIVDLATSLVTGAEALVRWQRPGHGMVPPAEFIELAEQTGLIVPLGEHVLDQACGQVRRWRSQGHCLGVAVNVSTRQLSDRGYASGLSRMLDAAELPPQELTIEVTESIWADETAMRTLMAIKRTGVRVALDDFGTGYSSLSYLQRYPFDIIKIDKSFTFALGTIPRTERVVACIISLAESLNAATVAEGVETPAQANWLRDAGCTFGQGYLFGKPDTADNWPRLSMPTTAV
jgi:diguanylate cyclase (GGDEF)-like protein